MLHWLHFLGALWLATTTAHTEHLSKNVVHATTMTTTFFKAFFTIFVIDITFLFVRKDLVCVLQFLELLSVTTTIRVIFQSEFSE